MSRRNFFERMFDSGESVIDWGILIVLTPFLIAMLLAMTMPMSCSVRVNSSDWPAPTPSPQTQPTPANPATHPRGHRADTVVAAGSGASRRAPALATHEEVSP
jgi:hypothetical protein